VGACRYTSHQPTRNDFVNPSNTPAATALPRRLTATQLLTRQDTYTRTQQLPSNFTDWQVRTGAGIREATTVPISRLISMLDCDHCDHCEGSRFAVVSKASTRGRYVSTVLDVPLKKVYRARHETGLVSFWKGVAKRRAQVKFLAAGESFLPASPEEPSRRARDLASLRGNHFAFDKTFGKPSRAGAVAGEPERLGLGAFSSKSRNTALLKP
jgi:hypothetical protein